VKIAAYLNTNEKEINSKRFDVWIGISLGNKYFSKENLKEYILWAIENTRKNVNVLIADELHAINLEILNGYRKERALNKTKRMSDKIEKEIVEIINGISKPIKILRWTDITNSSEYDKKLRVIRQEFKSDRKFHDNIFEIIKENPKAQSKNLSDDELENLSEYVIQELPFFITNEGVLPYPGMGKLDRLLIGLQRENLFPKLSKELKITKYLRPLEAYVD
jgi:tRNA-dependent cyclodipeptide synthase